MVCSPLLLAGIGTGCKRPPVFCSPRRTWKCLGCICRRPSSALPHSSQPAVNKPPSSAGCSGCKSLGFPTPSSQIPEEASTWELSGESPGSGRPMLCPAPSPRALKVGISVSHIPSVACCSFPPCRGSRACFHTSWCLRYC